MNGLIQLLAIAAGGAIGALMRYGVTQLTSPIEGINWGTFLVNFIGCFLICLLFFKYVDMTETTRLFLFVGLFGAFTTMSSVSLEMVQYFHAGDVWHAFFTFFLNAFICLGAGFLGRAVALM